MRGTQDQAEADAQADVNGDPMKPNTQPTRRDGARERHARDALRGAETKTVQRGLGVARVCETDEHGRLAVSPQHQDGSILESLRPAALDLLVRHMDGSEL